MKYVCKHSLKAFESIQKDGGGWCWLLNEGICQASVQRPAKPQNHWGGGVGELKITFLVMVGGRAYEKS